jgi:hypothetical protein
MDHIPKYRIPVRISLADKESMLGVIFIRQEQRILDMLCEQKPFFPVRTKTGMFLINKSTVEKVEVLEKQFILDHQEHFPETDFKVGFETHAELTKRRTKSMETHPSRPGPLAGLLENEHNR